MWKRITMGTWYPSDPYSQVLGRVVAPLVFVLTRKGFLYDITLQSELERLYKLEASLVESGKNLLPLFSSLLAW